MTLASKQRVDFCHVFFVVRVGTVVVVLYIIQGEGSTMMF